MICTPILFTVALGDMCAKNAAKSYWWPFTSCEGCSCEDCSWGKSVEPSIELARESACSGYLPDSRAGLFFPDMEEHILYVNNAFA